MKFLGLGLAAIMSFGAAHAFDRDDHERGRESAREERREARAYRNYREERAEHRRFAPRRHRKGHYAYRERSYGYTPQGYYGYPNGSAYRNLPPGLERHIERDGQLPPGLEKHLERDGRLPPGLEKR